MFTGEAAQSACKRLCLYQWLKASNLIGPSRSSVIKTIQAVANTDVSHSGRFFYNQTSCAPKTTWSGVLNTVCPRKRIPREVRQEVVIVAFQFTTTVPVSRRRDRHHCLSPREAAAGKNEEVGMGEGTCWMVRREREKRGDTDINVKNGRDRSSEPLIAQCYLGPAGWWMRGVMKG